MVIAMMALWQLLRYLGGVFLPFISTYYLCEYFHIVKDYCTKITQVNLSQIIERNLNLVNCDWSESKNQQDN